jgi:hypothetical protein
VPSVVGQLHHLDDDSSSSVIRRRRWLHRSTFGVLTAVLVLAVADGVSVVDVYGVDTREVRATGDGVTLVVEYAVVTRPALASPLRVRVESVEAFDGPITIAVSRPWIEIWDENGFYPTPSAETADGEWVEWQFDPPDGHVFELFYDARLEPARQESQDGTIELRAADGTALAAVDFTTSVRP